MHTQTFQHAKSSTPSNHTDTLKSVLWEHSIELHSLSHVSHYILNIQLSWTLKWDLYKCRMIIYLPFGVFFHTQSPMCVRPHQLPLHVFIPWWADEDGVLHKANKAPEGVTFILDLRQQGGNQVRHALAIAHVWIKHCVVEQDSPGAGTIMDMLILL